MADSPGLPTRADSGLIPAMILVRALELGERHGWDAVPLHEVARMAGISLTDIRHYFAQKDALTEAWFDRADQAMLAAPQTAGWAHNNVRQRLYDALFAWLNALAPHRQLTGEMLRYKLYPEHLRLQALGGTQIRRTVQWWQEAA